MTEDRTLNLHVKTSEPITFGQRLLGYKQWMYVDGDETRYNSATNEISKYCLYPINFNTALNAVATMRDISVANGEYCNLNYVNDTNFMVTYGVLKLNGRDASEVKKDLLMNTVRVLAFGN